MQTEQAGLRAGGMKALDVIMAVAEKLGYPTDEKTRKRFRSRWVSYISEKCALEANTLPITITQKVCIRDKWIFYTELDYVPMLGSPAIAQCGRILKVVQGYSIPAHYVVPDALDGEVTITYNVCAPNIANEQSELGLFSERFKSIVSYVEMREHMYCFNRGRLTRRKEFTAIVTDKPTEPQDGVVVCQHLQDDFYKLRYRCPCGCGITEELDAIIRTHDELGAREQVTKESDHHGRPYTVHRSMPRALRDKTQFMIEDGKISIQFIGPTKCFSQYSVENGIIKWRFMY